MVEQWRNVVGYEGLYEVSNLGQVRSVDRVIVDTLGRRRMLTGRIRRTKTDRYGYKVIQLNNQGSRTIAIHRLVLEAWVGPCPDDYESCHGPRGLLNNSVSNLRWDTRTANNNDRYKDWGNGDGRRKCVRRSDGVKYRSVRDAATRNNICRNSISAVCKGYRESAGGYGWQYYND